MLGFTITDVGVDLVLQAVRNGGMVNLTTCVLGDAGDPGAELDRSVSAVGREVYRKEFDGSDSYEIEGNKLKTVVNIPDSAGELTFNEIGYLDSDGRLVIYGVTGTVHKGAGGGPTPQTVTLENYIQLDQTQVDHVELVVGGATDKLREEVEALASRLAKLEGYGDWRPRVTALETTLEGVDEFLGGIS